MQSWRREILRFVSISLVVAAIAAGISSGAAAQVARRGAGSDVATKDLSVMDFSHGRTLIMESNTPVQTVALDYAVYRRSIGPRLSDLRVFDGAGRAVPYAIRRGFESKRAESKLLSVPIFRLDGSTLGPKISGRIALGDDFAIDAEVSASGARVRVVPRDPSPASPVASAATGWILDVRGIKEEIVELHFELGANESDGQGAGGGGDYVRRYRVEKSDDLVHFQPVREDVAFVRLIQSGHRIEQQHFSLPALQTKYLRLTPTTAVGEIEIRSARARTRARGPKEIRDRHRVAGRFDEQDSRVVHFDLEAAPPIDSVRLQLVDTNSVLEGRLESSPTGAGPWRTRQAGLFYALDRGTRLHNSAVRTSPFSDRYFRFTASSRGGGVMQSPPLLEVEWPAERLIFVAREPAPMQLAVGRIDTRDGSFSAAELLRLAGSEKRSLLEPTTSLGPEVVLGGDEVRHLKVAIPWRQYSLWVLLIASVAVALGLSFRLMRLSRQEHDEPS